MREETEGKERLGSHSLSRIEIGDRLGCGADQLAARLPLIVLGTVALPAHQQLATSCGSALREHAFHFVAGDAVRIRLHCRRLLQSLRAVRK